MYSIIVRVKLFKINFWCVCMSVCVCVCVCVNMQEERVDDDVLYVNLYLCYDFYSGFCMCAHIMLIYPFD